MSQGNLKRASYFLMALLFLLPSVVLGDTVEYFYDDIGRLVRVMNGNERVLYHHNEVGNFYCDWLEYYFFVNNVQMLITN